MLETPSASKDAPFAPEAVRQMRSSVLLDLLEGWLARVTSKSQRIDFSVLLLFDRDLFAVSQILLSRSHQRVVMPCAPRGAVAT